MRTLLTALTALSFVACAPEGGLEGQDQAALLYESQPSGPQPLGMAEVCNDNKDNDLDGQTDEQPCRRSGLGGFLSGSGGDGQGIMVNPEDLRAPWDSDTYTMSANRDGDIEITLDGKLIGIVELPEGVRSVQLIELTNDRGASDIGLVLDPSGKTSPTYVMSDFDGVFSAGLR